jgi:hypothetical protein
MQSDGAVTNNSNLPGGLPPVEPPSGRFLAQLFLVPLVIVSVLVLLAVAGIWLSKGRYGQGDAANTDYFLRELRSNNADVWWRAAYDLAQVIKRPESLALASHPRFGLDLAEKLRQELTELEQLEKSETERTRNLSQEDKDNARRKLRDQRDRVNFLISSLGDFTVPTGVPLLREIAVRQTSPDVKGVTQRRRLAVWALANLGQNLKRYAELPREQQDSNVTELAAEMAGKDPRAAWARTTHAYLTNRQPLGVDATLEQCAASEDTFLREVVAMALNFWDGPRAEPTLRQLSRDDGHGTRIEITEAD